MSDNSSESGNSNTNEIGFENGSVEGLDAFPEVAEMSSEQAIVENATESRETTSITKLGEGSSQDKNVSDSGNQDFRKELTKNRLKIKESVLRKDPFIGQVFGFHQENPFFFDRSNIFWFWNSQSFMYEQVDEIDLMNELEQTLDLGGMTTPSQIKAQFIEAFKRVGRRFQPQEAPKHFVQFHDTIFDLKEGVEFRASPTLFITNPIPYKLVHDGETPVMDKFLADWVGKENVRQLKQIIAYCMLPDYPISRIFCFIGGGRNGKSTFMEMVQKFLGGHNYCSSELDSLMGGRFEMAKLFKKLACFMGETNFNTMNKTNRLKQLSGRDPISIEYKNKNPFDTVNYAKLLISTNGLPQSNDHSDGFYRRWLIIDFPNQFTESVDVLGMIPESEYEALTGQCLKLLVELLQTGKFDNEGTVEERAELYVKMSDPIQMFIDSELVQDWNGFISKKEFHERLNDYCEKKKYRKIGLSELGKMMNSKGIRTVRPRQTDEAGNDIRPPCFEGFRLKDQEVKEKFKLSIQEETLETLED